MLDETDYKIVHALQIAPRAPWGAVGEVVGISAATASRRWDRLVLDGMAWVISYPGPRHLAARCSAFIEIVCQPELTQEVVRKLTKIPHVATIRVVSGDTSLLLTIMIADLESLSAWVRSELNMIRGVREVRMRIVTRIYGDDRQWRLDFLNAEQRHALQRYVLGSRELSVLPRKDEVPLINALAYNGRRSAVDLANAIGVSAPTVRRRLDRLIAERLLSVHCEIANVLNGWPVIVTLWAKVPSLHLDEIGTALIRIPEIRLCCAITGRSNLVMTAWLHHIADLHDLERRLVEQHPSLSLVSREVNLYTPKHLGVVLDSQGRRTGIVPINFDG